MSSVQNTRSDKFVHLSENKRQGTFNLRVDGGFGQIVATKNQLRVVVRKISRVIKNDN